MIIYQCKPANIINLCYSNVGINVIKLACIKLIEWQNHQLVFTIQSNQQRTLKQFNLMLKHCIINYYRNESSLNAIWLTYVSCSSSDKCLVNECNSCPLSSVNSCSHSEDVTLDCGKKYIKTVETLHVQRAYSLFILLHLLRMSFSC